MLLLLLLVLLRRNRGLVVLLQAELLLLLYRLSRCHRQRHAAHLRRRARRGALQQVHGERAAILLRLLRVLRVA